MSTPRGAVSSILDPAIHTYLRGLEPDEDPLVERLAAHAAVREFPLIGRDSGRWLELLTRVVGGRRVFEFGSGFGFSAFWFARAVGPDGQVIGSEKDTHHIEAFQDLYGDHLLRARIDIRHGLAMEVFAATEGLFDVVLLDLDKEGYVAAMEAAVPRLRTGGLLLADNALWGGRVAHPEIDDPSTRALRAFNERLLSHPELDALILPVGDGLAVGLKT
jgi:predicted O-methyltransferase YrrM